MTHFKDAVVIRLLLAAAVLFSALVLIPPPTAGARGGGDEEAEKAGCKMGEDFLCYFRIGGSSGMKIAYTKYCPGESSGTEGSCNTCMKVKDSTCVIPGVEENFQDPDPILLGGYKNVMMPQ